MNQVQQDATDIINDTADKLAARFNELIQNDDDVIDALMQASIFFVNDLGMFNDDTQAELAVALMARVCVTSRL